MISAFLDGWRRVARAPMLLAGVAALTLLLAAPLALTLRGMLAAHLGASLAADEALRGVNHDWWQEFQFQATGLGTTFVPGIIGFSAPLKNVSDFADAHRPTMPVLGAIVAYAVAWTFLLGGILDRLARQHPIRSYGFFAASGTYFFRFVRLAAVSGLCYWFLFATAHTWLFTDAWEALTRDLTVERTAFAWRLLLYGVFAAMLSAVTVVFDYAKVRMVVEDRLSALGALKASLRFVRQNAGAVAGLYLLNAAMWLIVLAVYALVAPGARWWVPAAVVVSQLYIVARLAVKLAFLASATSLFQSRLAHARYTAAPAVRWPESPAAEAVMRE